MWFDLKGDARLGRCATEGCGGQPTFRLEADGVGSNYCSGCRAKLIDETDILPCPFCGKPPFVEPTGFHGGGRTIRCEADDCMGPHTTAACVADAVVQWNRRA